MTTKTLSDKCIVCSHSKHIHFNRDCNATVEEDKKCICRGFRNTLKSAGKLIW